MENKYDFIWRGSLGKAPYLRDENGNIVELTVDKFVPYLLEPHYAAANACPAPDAAPLAVGSSSSAGEGNSGIGSAAPHEQHLTLNCKLL